MNRLSDATILEYIHVDVSFGTKISSITFGSPNPASPGYTLNDGTETRIASPLNFSGQDIARVIASRISGNTKVSFSVDGVLQYTLPPAIQLWPFASPFIEKETLQEEVDAVTKTLNLFADLLARERGPINLWGTTFLHNMKAAVQFILNNPALPVSKKKGMLQIIRTGPYKKKGEGKILTTFVEWCTKFYPSSTPGAANISADTFVDEEGNRLDHLYSHGLTSDIGRTFFDQPLTIGQSAPEPTE